jgi:lysophospholipase L1-like esterase
VHVPWLGRPAAHLSAATFLAAIVACSSTPDPGASPGATGGDAAGGTTSSASGGTDAGAAGDPGDDGGANRDGDAGAQVEMAPFHIVGRIDTRSADGPRFGWAGTELRARFTGSGLGVDLADRGTSYYDVSVDGAPPATLIVSGARRTYEAAAALPSGVHEVVLTKRTETQTGVTQFFGFVPSPGGALVPSPVPTGRRIELVGDSITCGYGLLGADETCHFSPETEAEPLAWGALAARELGALHTTIAVSGMGVYRNYGGATTNTMPERYDRALADDPASAWTHAAFEPDVIVVGLGTNDFAGGQGDPGPVFETTYTAFLAKLRATHPVAHIVLATSPMLSGQNHAKQHAYLANALATRSASGDARISLLDIEEMLEADGYACDWHPSTVTQRKMAAKLAMHLRSVMRW